MAREQSFKEVLKEKEKWRREDERWRINEAREKEKEREG